MTQGTITGRRCAGSFGRRIHLAFAGTLLASALSQAQSAALSPDYITRAIADTARPAEQVRLDVWRKPAAVIAFSGLKPGQRATFTHSYPRRSSPTVRPRKRKVQGCYGGTAAIRTSRC